MTSGGNNFNHFGENQLIKFNARDAGDFNDASDEREIAQKCGSLRRDAGDFVACVGLYPQSALRPRLVFLYFSTLNICKWGSFNMVWLNTVDSGYFFEIKSNFNKLRRLLTNLISRKYHQPLALRS